MPTTGLTDKDLINYAYTIRDKIRENERVMHQIANNAPEQAILKELQAGFQQLIFEMLRALGRAEAEGGEAKDEAAQAE